MEYWKIGILGKAKKKLKIPVDGRVKYLLPIIPVFHHSNIPMS